MGQKTSKRCELEVVPVAFNVLDDEQNRLWIHVTSKMNRSGYIKRLIERDLNGFTAYSVVDFVESEPVDERDEDDLAGRFLI